MTKKRFWTAAYTESQRQREQEGTKDEWRRRMNGRKKERGGREGRNGLPSSSLSRNTTRKKRKAAKRRERDTKRETTCTALFAQVGQQAFRVSCVLANRVLLVFNNNHHQKERKAHKKAQSSNSATRETQTGAIVVPCIPSESIFASSPSPLPLPPPILHGKQIVVCRGGTHRRSRGQTIPSEEIIDLKKKKKKKKKKREERGEDSQKVCVKLWYKMKWEDTYGLWAQKWKGNADMIHRSFSFTFSFLTLST